tara:strand:+ start:23786 stop:30733 length:6948 start_codon:yes stop_codon:yes gene_type:complete
MRLIRKTLSSLILFVVLVYSIQSVYGQTPITSITTNSVTVGLTTSSYTATSPSDASGGITPSTSYTVNYGQNRNLFPTSYTVGVTVYDRFILPDTLIIQRTDAGRQLIIFYEEESTAGNTVNIQPEQQENEDALYQSGLINAGYDNILVNNATNFANVERVDVIYYSGVLTATPDNAVFPVVERGGNDDIKVAAIRGLDSNGDPNDYYPTVVQVNNNGTSEWGNSGISHVSVVFRRQTATSDPLPVQVLGTQNIYGSAISFSDFGITSNDIVYGYSIFADDVDETTIDITNISEFPTDTNSNSGLDLIAGISTAVASDDNLTTATGPGGYKAALNTWLKANVGVTTATDGSTVTDWQDQWLGNHDATTLTTAPTYRDGTASEADDINFNPTVDFLDASERGLLIANNSDFNTATSYEKKGITLAFRTGNDISTKQQIYEQGSNDRGLNVYVRNNEIYIGAWNVTNDGAGSPWGFNSVNTSALTGARDVTTDTEYIITLEFDGNASETGDVVAYLNGQSFGTISNVGLLFSDTNGIGLGDTNGQSRYDDGTTAAASFYGSIAELVYCNEPGAFSFAQRNRIESYLAIKYGITLDQSTALSYVNSDGSIIFNTANSRTIGGYLEYNADIAGIGRDDASEFEQRQSKSENSGSLVTMARTEIGTDGTFLIWGNDEGALTTVRTEVPDVIFERLERVWRVAEENEMGQTDISFDLTSLGLGTDPNDFALLIGGVSSLGDFSSGTVVGGGTFSGDVITFPNINLADGQYFTLATQYFICTPGNVPDGLALWLKADAETFNTGTTLATNGQTVDTWADQGRNSFDATIGTNRAPSWVENSVNFNPGLNFPNDAGSNAIGFNLGSNYIFADDADGGLHVFSTIEPIDVGTTNNTRQQKMIYSFGNRTARNVGFGSSDQRGTIQSPGSNSNFNVSPAGASFTVEADYDISAGASDVENFILDGEIINTATISFQLDDANIDEDPTHQGNAGPVSIGRQSENNSLDSNNGRRFFGDMNEVIVYNAEITDLQAQQVRSYLALKYGSTLTENNDADGTANEVISGAVREGDYVASNGSTITWAYNDDTGFVSNVAGIGRDDDTCLDQKQSSSVNSDAILAMGLGGIEATNADNANSFVADNSFLTWATDGASTTFANITTAGTPGTVTERMLRVWRAQETGTVGATEISFDLTGLTGYSTDAGEYQLIIAGGGDNTSLENGNTFTGGTFNGSVLSFSGIDLADGEYFTLGVALDNCGPGGVTTDLTVWLKADAGTSTTTDNTNLITWSDQSLDANDAVTDGTPPLYRNNTTDNINFLPTIAFDGTDDRLSLGNLSEIKSGGTNAGDYTLIAVGIREDGPEWNFVIGSEGGTGNEDLHFGYRNNNTELTVAHWANDLNLTGRDAFDTPALTPFLISGRYSGNNRDLEEIRNGGFGRITEAEIVDISGTKTNFIGDVESLGNYNGRISEVIVFDNDITDLQKLQVYSYLGVKYGLSLPQDNDGDATLNETISGSVAEGDYVASDGTTIIWDESNSNSAYHNDIAGIGRDDAACLNQKQSTSGNDDDIITMGLGSVETNNASNSNFFGGNQRFLLWGNDDASTLEANAINSSDGGTPDLPSTIAQRMERVWRVEDTGTVGATEIQFDLTGLGYTSVADNFSMIVSNSPTMASGTLITGGTFNGSVLSFPGVDLTDGQYFTLATENESCGPGGVNTNLELWLRADVGTSTTTDGTDLATWDDQSINGNDASETNFGGGAIVEPTYESNEINGNPVIRFNDTNTTNSAWMETAAATNTTSGDLSMIAVYKTTQNQGSTTNFQDTPSLIGANSGGTDDYGLGMTAGRVHVNASNNSTLNARDASTSNNFEPYIASATRDVDSPFDLELYVNSANVASATSDNTALTGPDTWAIGNHSTPDNEAQFQGDIAEAIVFSSTLTGEERTRVETYLAIKYGITRTVASLPAAEQDYLAGDGGIIWDYDNQGTTYHNDIAGIGRDDISCFSQLSSKSENDDALVTMSVGSLPDDDSFIIWGNDNAAIEDETNREKPATINSRLNREWRVQETGTVGEVMLTFDLSTITGPGDVVGANNLTQLRLLVDNDGNFNTGATLIEPSSTNAIDNTVTFTVNFGTGQYFTLGSEEEGALPVTLISFKAESLEDATVKLKWETSDETNNAFYSIERSGNGSDFEVVANVNGAGTTESTTSYTYTDQSPLEGVSFYRLKQTDFNGVAKFSEIVRVIVLFDQTGYSIKVYPNPVRSGSDITVALQDEIFKIDSYRIFNSQGKLFFEEVNIGNEKTIKINTKLLPQGIYIVHFINDGLVFGNAKILIL